MKFNLAKILIPLLCYLLSCKLLFWLFSPSEVWTMILIPLLLFFCYGIQNVEWTENSSTTLFKLTIHSRQTVYQQYRAFGIIPLSPVRTLDTSTAYLEDIDAPKMLSTGKRVVILALPVIGQFLSNISKNRSLR